MFAMAAIMQPKVGICQQPRFAVGDIIIKTMETKFASRLDFALTQAGIPKDRARLRRVASMFGVSREAARKWLTGMAVPETRRIMAIAKRLRVSAEWLLTGSDHGQAHGRGHTSPPAVVLTEIQQSIIDLLNDLTEAQQEELLRWVERTKKQNDAVYNELARKKGRLA